MVETSQRSELPADIAAGVSRGEAEPAEYEFNRTQDEVFRGLASAMKFVGIAMLVLGGFNLLAATMALSSGRPGSVVSSGISGAVMLAIGVWTRSVAQSIARITTTSGRDISLLMEAMTHLKRIYGFQRFVLILAMALVAIGFLLAVSFAR